MAAGVVEVELGFLDPGLGEGIAGQGVARGGADAAESEVLAAQILEALDVGVLGHPDAAGVRAQLALGGAEGGQRFGAGALGGEDVARGPNWPMSSLPFCMASTSAE